MRRRGRSERNIRSSDVIETLAELMVRRGAHGRIRSDNGLEFTVGAVRKWLGRVGARVLYIESGASWENGYIESFNSKPMGELLERLPP